MMNSSVLILVATSLIVMFQLASSGLPISAGPLPIDGPYQFPTQSSPATPPVLIAPQLDTYCPIISNPPSIIGVHKLEAVKDVLLESGTTNFNNLDLLIIGNHPGFPKKRSLLQFQNLPGYCTNIVSAKMYIWYWYSHKASGLSDAAVPHLEHTFKVHQVKKEWVESQATSSYRKTGVAWSKPYLGLDGTDAESNYLDSVNFSNPPPTGICKWLEFDITVAARKWASGQPNYGVVVWSDRENDNGRDVRFYSREYSSNKPFISVTCGH